MKKLLIIFQIFILAFYSCQKENSKTQTIKIADYKKAESFLNRQNDSAFYYFNKVVTTSKDSFEIALAYNGMGTLQAESGDYFGGQESLSQSLRFLNEDKREHRGCFASNYNELGLSSMNLKNYDAAVSFYDAAGKFLDHRDFELIVLNNKALAYQKQGSYSKALQIYYEVLAETEKNSVEYARVLSNIARTKWLRQSTYQAAPELLTALNIRTIKKDLWGLNASYAHLADYYTRTKQDSALFYADKMYAVAKQLNSPDDRIEALQKLIRLSPAGAVKRYFTTYQRLSDSLQSARNAAKNQFAFIRYEAEKNKADNQKLQRENTEKKYQIIKQQVLLGSTVFILVTLSILAVFWYRRRKQRIERDAQDVIRENQLRTSKKVHDVVANGLYRIMTEIEHRDELDKDRLLDQIEVMYEQSRDISYENQRPADENFQEKITEILTSFTNENTRVRIICKSQNIWEGISESARCEVEHILQELMVNMRKHSRAANVALLFEQGNDYVQIRYTDDGVGLPADVRYGNGLKNTENRINTINGTITFDTGTAKGLQVRITFPVA